MASKETGGDLDEQALLKKLEEQNRFAVLLDGRGIGRGIGSTREKPQAHSSNRMHPTRVDAHPRHS